MTYKRTNKILQRTYNVTYKILQRTYKRTYNGTTTYKIIVSMCTQILQH